ELGERAIAVAHRLRRQALDADDEGLGLGASVRFDDADEDIAALLLERAGSDDHHVGLAHAGRASEVDLHVAGRRLRLFLLQPGEELVGIRASIAHWVTSVLRTAVRTPGSGPAVLMIIDCGSSPPGVPSSSGACAFLAPSLGQNCCE